LSPLLVADVVVTLALDAESVGRIVVIRADCELYDVDPEVPIRMSSGWPGERRAGHTRLSVHRRQVRHFGARLPLIGSAP
jgi:hypothetical protein